MRLRKRRDSKGNGATGLTSATKMCAFKTFATEVETARLCRPKRRRRDFSDQGGDGAIFQNEVETARTKNHSSLPRRRRRIFPHQGGDGATFQTMRRRRDFSDQCGDGATFQTKTVTGGGAFQNEVEMARPRNHSSLPKRRLRVFPDQGGDGATFQTNAETARQSGDGANFQNEVEILLQNERFERFLNGLF